MRVTSWITVSALALFACDGTPRASAEPNPSPKSGPANQQQSAAKSDRKEAPVQLGPFASCQPSAQVSDAVDRLVGFADPNSDGKVTRGEASSAANFLIGGFFFRADENGDGVVTPEEGVQARKDFASQQPAFANLLQATRDAGGEGPFATLASMLDVRYGEPVRAEQARSAARRAVDDIFQTADGNKNDAITADEARAASWRAAQALGDGMFHNIDTNDDKQLTLPEFQKGLEGPASIAFKMADKNADGHLTQTETGDAIARVTTQLGLPQPKR
jgi:Ca2+-binding EF-hand superfamily protein